MACANIGLDVSEAANRVRHLGIDKKKFQNTVDIEGQVVLNKISNSY